MITILNLIDGRLIPSSSGEIIKNIDPSTNAQYATIPDSNAQDIDDAVNAAEKAFPAWSSLSEGIRANKLRNLALLKNILPI